MFSPNTNVYGITILHYCGSGAYGDVYFGQDLTGKKLALKIISKNKIGSDWDRELKGITNYRAFSEDIPELLKLYHVGEDDDNFFYTMEPADAVPDEPHYVPDTLAKRLENGPLPAEQLIPFLQSILHCITLLHQAGYAHRDIKPDNILFVHGIPKLADLGLLSPLSGTMTKLAGTLDFIPPEQRAGSVSSHDHHSRQRSDLYAFGKIIYCCVSGNSADLFPSLPPTLPLTPLNKQFFKLAMQLSHKEPALRINQLDALQAAFDKAVDVSLHGETLTGRICSAADSSFRTLLFALQQCGQGILHHWAFALCGFALFGAVTGGILHAVWPEPPFDITKLTVKPFENKELGIAMDIPVEWEHFTKESVKKKLNELEEGVLPKDMADNQSFMAMIAMQLELGGDFFLCRGLQPIASCVLIQPLPNVPELNNLWEESLEDLRIQYKQLFNGEMGLDSVIHDVRRISLQGHDVLFLDISHDDESRCLVFNIRNGTTCFSISMNASTQDFSRLKDELTAVLKSLRFTSQDK